MQPPALRISADFNSGGTNGSACWCLHYAETPLDACEVELGLKEGQRVILFHEDAAEEFEVDAVLQIGNGLPKWQALPDWETLRRLRG